jgi:hypothetical protein
MSRMTSNVYSSEKTTTTTTGHVIGASSGLVFVLVNSAPLLPALRIVVCIAAVGMFFFIVAGLVATRHASPRSKAQDAALGFTERYMVIVGVEAVLLFGGLAIMRLIEPAAILGWIALVVGVHFFPLSRLWTLGRAQITTIAIAMTALGVAGLILAFTTHNADAVELLSGVGSGTLLLGTAFVVALRTLTRRPAAR